MVSYPEKETSIPSGTVSDHWGMFSTPPSASAESRRDAQRRLSTAVGRLNSARNQTSVATDDAEPPIASEGDSHGEVLSVLRSLQQQVSALQAQQQATQAQVEVSPRITDGSTSSTPNSTKRRLPKELVVSFSIFNFYIVFPLSTVDCSPNHQKFS